MRTFFTSCAYPKKAHIRYVGGAADSTADGGAAEVPPVAKGGAEGESACWVAAARARVVPGGESLPAEAGRDSLVVRLCQLKQSLTVPAQLVGSLL
ncbi:MULTISPECIES: hypothetical protein, partial [unclassified Micromonospora]|uniref:hypothetical protein n=1 Tax=unclassified Micromonospora TaxID=2617518 RepID=UPI002FF31B82